MFDPKMKMAPGQTPYTPEEYARVQALVGEAADANVTEQDEVDAANPLRKHAQAALDVQTACNMGGVARAFNDAVQALWTEAHRIGKGTDWVNQHPICVLFAVQIAHLSGGYNELSSTAYGTAVEACEKLAGVRK